MVASQKYLFHVYIRWRVFSAKKSKFKLYAFLFARTNKLYIHYLFGAISSSFAYKILALYHHALM